MPLYVSTTEELVDTLNDTPANRAVRLSDGGYTDLVSKEIESVARDRKMFTDCYKNRPVYEADQEADVVFYSLFTVAWGVVRSAIESLGVYGNHRKQCIEDFVRLCGDITDTSAFEKIFETWDKWEEEGSPSFEESKALALKVYEETKKLDKALGDSSEFTAWPPKAI